MDQVKTGAFIAELRKEKGLTQKEVAEKLGVADKTVSKWETGRGLPEVSLMMPLCEVLGITVNELLSGEKISADKYVDKAEEHLYELQTLKANADRRLLSIEIVLGVLSIIILLSLTMIASYLQMEDWLRIVIIVFAFAVSITGVGFALKIEQVAGYYVCAKCGHKYVPTFKQVFWAAHCGRTRHMKCPNCKERSWQKKVVE
ncbi:MAG: helix-turn-helix transcriptional regulator [Clostridia bacterium]|nr:helix-turn-helix transcriptional regulator [Clostridia bacterium]